MCLCHAHTVCILVCSYLGFGGRQGSGEDWVIRLNGSESEHSAFPVNEYH